MLDRAPKNLLEEIILVDDFSDRGEQEVLYLLNKCLTIISIYF